ncbi:hypothetical protein CDL15_Pgr010330 [Punica granatum]|uniref:BZIP domain-containing protein n=3 Tax=Punica granatum TaxID=22663 RepID=A0A218W2D2_PUNGR|nr:hypothetical protein CDL15_Pgr010330 [Punica granatum]
MESLNGVVAVEGTTNQTIPLPPLMNGLNQIVIPNQQGIAAFMENRSNPASHHQPSQGTLPPTGNGANKKQVRAIANKEYLRNYRLKKITVTMQMEAELKALQDEIAAITPRIKNIDHQNGQLKVENDSVKEKISSYMTELVTREAKYEELRQERDVLKQIYDEIHGPPEQQESTMKNLADPKMMFLLDQDIF